MSKRLVATVVTCLAVASGSSLILAQEQLVWPDELVHPLAAVADALVMEEGPDARLNVFLAAQTDAVIDAAEASPGGAIFLLMANAELSSVSAMSALTAILSELAKTDPDGMSLKTLEMLLVVTELFKSGIPPTPGEARALGEAIAGYDEQAAILGLPTIRELIAERLPGDSGLPANAALDEIDAINASFDHVDDLGDANAEATARLLNDVRRLIPPFVVSPALGGQIGAAFGEQQEWAGAMWDMSSEVMGLTVEAMRTGQMDQEKLSEFTGRAEELKKGPWTSILAVDAVKRLCEGLPSGLGRLCAELWDDIFVEFDEIEGWLGCWSLHPWGEVTIGYRNGNGVIDGYPATNSFLESNGGTLSVQSVEAGGLSGTYRFEIGGGVIEGTFSLTKDGIDTFVGQATGDLERPMWGSPCVSTS